MNAPARNALAKEKSPYLLQHAENPVDWLPWGEAAFAKAKAEGKPIFLSIGYSTCHWCHVMAHESFEDPATARLLNELFVPVKVDREERPDVDRLYMAYVQATTGHGGWPMSVWLTPELKPFYGGTYFAPDGRYGRPGFPVLLRRLADLWRTERESILAQSDRVFESFAELAPADEDGNPDAAPPDPRAIAALGFAAFRSRFDAVEGGFGHAPKFPRPAVFDFLFRHAARLRLEKPDAPEAKEAARMALFTLDKMAAGGMRDHLGGGFHRYSVDTYWHVPHFEKMLYDQAQLALAYAEAHRLTGGIHPGHAAVLRETLDYLLREMADPVGAFHSAEDADSLPHEEAGKPGAHPMEGAFYVWGAAEIARLLPPETAKLFAFVHGVDADGNAPAGSDPHGEFVGKNILLRRHPLAEAARRFGLAEDEAAARLTEARAILLEARRKRPLPHRDDKILTAWNGLAVSALAVGAQVLEDARYRDAAVRAASFLLGAMKGPDGRLLRAYRQGPGTVGGFAEDYAFLIAGLLDLHEATLETRWLKEALALQKTMDALFLDVRQGGYFSSAEGDPTLPLRMKEEYDGAEPAPHSVAAGNLLRLHRLTGDEAFRDRAQALFRAARPLLERAPDAVPRLLGALEESLLPPLHLVIVGPPEAESEATRALLREARRGFAPHRALLRFSPGEPIPELFGALAPFYASLRQVDGKPTAFLCEDFACRLPTSDPVVLRNSLEKHSQPPGEVI